jgi:hypothetical protein
LEDVLHVEGVGERLGGQKFRAELRELFELRAEVGEVRGRVAGIPFLLFLPRFGGVHPASGFFFGGFDSSGVQGGGGGHGAAPQKDEEGDAQKEEDWRGGQTVMTSKQHSSSCP